MKNTSSTTNEPNERILLVGRTGSGKTAQIRTLPGRKFAYLFDPNSMRTLQGADVDVEEFYPSMDEIDPTLKGFNKGAKSDRPSSPKEPRLYERWVEDFNQKHQTKFFQNYDWLIFDSLTFFTKSVMDRQMFINSRLGDIQDLGDYRVVGNKLTDVFRSISGLPINIYCTGHINSFQDEKTKKIETQLNIPGNARTNIPLMFTNIWMAHVQDKAGKLRHMIRTRPDPRGLQDIRTSIAGLAEDEDVTIEDMNKAENFGIGALLRKRRS